MADSREKLLELGKYVHENANGMELDGRPVTNIEMHACCQYVRDTIERQIAAGTCRCAEGPYLGGMCRRVAAVRCPLWADARQILHRMEQDG
jgi:hypothetical protein